MTVLPLPPHFSFGLRPPQSHLPFVAHTTRSTSSPQETCLGQCEATNMARWLSTGPGAGSSGRGSFPLWGLEVADPPRPSKEASWSTNILFCCLLSSDVAAATSWPSFFLWTLPSPISPLPKTPSPLGFSCREGLCEGCCCQVCYLSTRLVSLPGEGKKAPLQGSLQLGATGRMGPSPEEGHVGLFPGLHVQLAVREAQQ